MLSWHLPFGFLPLVLLSISLLEDAALAAPNLSGRQFHELLLSRPSRPQRNVSEWGVWVHFQRNRLARKYEVEDRLMQRSNGLNLLTNQNADSSYFGSLTVGTPPVSFNVILDTGSSDFWLATDEAFHEDEVGTPGYNPSVSVSYVPMNTTFSIKYGSGAASGILGKDTVQMAGFTVDGQIFGVVSNMTENMLSTPVSGLLGLAFPNIATSRAMPFWLNVAAGPGILDDALMAFHLTRYVNDNEARSSEPGGTFTLGSVNTTLYQGEIDFQDVPDGHVGYWILELTSLMAQNTSLTLPSTPSYVAIDTGTTLVGGPASMIQQLYQTIPGSEPGTGDYEGYYTYPCAATVSVSLRFGNSSIYWPVSALDFRLAQLSSDTCLGAFFEFKTSSTTGPTWIVGDTFLKNVYSVFRVEPKPSIGFAMLSVLAESMNGQGGALPTPTFTTTVAAVTAQDGLARTSDTLLTTSTHIRLLLVLLIIAWFAEI